MVFGQTLHWQSVRAGESAKDTTEQLRLSSQLTFDLANEIEQWREREQGPDSVSGRLTLYLYPSSQYKIRETNIHSLCVGLTHSGRYLPGRSRPSSIQIQ